MFIGILKVIFFVHQNRENEAILIGIATSSPQLIPMKMN